MQRYTPSYADESMYANARGNYVFYSDVKAAISEARLDERRKCVAEVRELLEKRPNQYEAFGYQSAIETLTKGLPQ